MVLATQVRSPAPPTLNDVFEAEQQIVGLILTEASVYGRIAAILRDDDWTENLHRGVFEVARRLIDERCAVSVESVLPRVSDVAPDGGPARPYLATLAARAPAAGRVEPLARILADAARARTGPDHLDRDLYAWAFEQAQALRRGDLTALDALGLAEEIEDLGGAIYSRLESALRITVMHILKWDHQPERRSRSWHLTIRNGRLDIEESLERSPSLKRRLETAVERAYHRARMDAASETGLAEQSFPSRCPYDLNEIMSRPIDWPPGSAEP